MAKIRAFKAIRPTRDKAHLVATRPVYSYQKNVLEAKMVDNPFTFLHIINPEFGSKKMTEPNSNERFELISEGYAEFIDKGILIQDERQSIYIYRQTKIGNSFTGIICGASVEEYKNGLIKKHEATITSREEIFTNYLNIVGYNAEPVLLSHSKSIEIEKLIENCVLERPEYEFTTTDLFTHELWILSKKDTELTQAAFAKLDKLYIADGHHRTASSVRLFDSRQSRENRFENENSFLAFLIDENQVEILEFNRLVRSLNGHSSNEVLDRLSNNFDVEELDNAKHPSKEHEITMFLDGNWYKLNCKDSIIDPNHPVKSLDAEILTEQILTPILNIRDLKSSEEIEFISGGQPLARIENKVKSGDYAIAFVLYPISIDQVKKVADNNMIMPPKSTWVEPKLRSGLTIYKIDE